MTNSPASDRGGTLLEHALSADGRTSAHVHLVVSGENRRLLSNWLSDDLGYEVVRSDPGAIDLGSIDVCVCDLPALRRHGEALASNKRAAEPVYLPYLLLLPERQVRSNRADLWARVRDLFPPGVDDLIRTPTTPIELEGRLESLLQARELSLRLRRKASALETQRRINAVIREINGVLVRARSREEIEAEVCERLTDADPYRFAWIGETNATARTVHVRTCAGDGIPPPERVSATSGADAHPAERALSTREAVTAQPATIVSAAKESEDSDDPWTEWLRERGFGGLISVPVAFGDTVYGVLEVYADRPIAFDSEETAVLTELGSSIGYAINAAETKRLLQTERLTEVTFRIADDSEFLVDLSAATGATFRLNGIVPSGTGTTLEYFAVTGADPAAVADRAAASEAVADARILHEGETEGGVRFDVDDDVLSSIANAGVSFGDVTVADGVVTVTAILPQESDVRAFARGILSNYRDADLVTQRHVDHDDVTELEFRQSFESALTERQRTVLEAAYFAGYFDRPRASTGEEIAESLGISAATFHQHVRTSERKLLDAFFD